MSCYSKLHDLCLQKSITVSVAESCTSGLIASNITSKSGSSLFFKGGIIAYQNEIKSSVLGLDPQSIIKYSEVSVEIVSQMAEAVKGIFISDYAIATSGYAGLSGGTHENPVGTVFIAISGFDGTSVERCFFSGDRRSIIKQASERSGCLLYESIKKS